MPSRKEKVLNIESAFLREIPIVQKAAPKQESAAPATAARVTALRHPVGTEADRRKRWRAKIVGRVHIRGSVGTIDVFEDIGKTVDVNRDGLLLNTSRSGYWVGQQLQVTFPFWTVPTAINTPRSATVVRNIPLPGFRYAVAVKFDSPNAQAQKPNSHASQVRILCVASTQQLSEPVHQLLVRDGYEVVTVQTPDQALDILQSETPHAVLAEAEMVASEGGPSGRELCVLIKRTHRLQHVPVILLTNSALPSDYSASRRAGAMLCVPMPCEPERVQRAVHLVAPPPGHRSAYETGYNIASFVRNSS